MEPFLHIVTSVYQNFIFVRTGPIVGIVVGLVVIVAAICAYLWWWRRKQAKIERIWLMQIERANNVSANMILPFRAVSY